LDLALEFLSISQAEYKLNCFAIYSQ